MPVTLRFLKGFQDHTSLPEWDEEGLIQLLINGDQSAFSRLYFHYAERLLYKIKQLVKSSEAAEEMLQDIFFKVWQRRAALDRRFSLGPLLYKMAENKIYDHYRFIARDKKRQQYLFDHFRSLITEDDELLIAEQNEKVLRQAIASLPEQRRKVFELCKLEGHSYLVVSQLLGISTSTINDHLVKANKAIRDYFAANHDIFIPIYISILLAWPE